MANYAVADTSSGTAVRITGPSGATLCFLRTLPGSTSYVQIVASEGADISSTGGQITPDRSVAVPCATPHDSTVQEALGDPGRPTIHVQSTGASVRYRFTRGGL